MTAAAAAVHGDAWPVRSYTYRNSIVDSRNGIVEIVASCPSWAWTTPLMYYMHVSEKYMWREYI